MSPAPAPPAPRFSFESVALEPVIAHGGGAPVRFCRARSGSDGDALRFVDFTIVPAGADIGRHTHDLDNEELYIVVSGRGVMEAGDERFEVGPGSVVINPPGGTHALTNPGPDELRLVVVEVRAEP